MATGAETRIQPHRTLETSAATRLTNHCGMEFNQLTSLNRKFSTYALAQANQPIIDLGCSTGLSSQNILKQRKRVIACDLNAESLEIMRSATPEELRPFLETRAGSFPRDFEFDPGSISAVHCANLIHFLTGEEVMTGLAKIRRWLEPNGKLFLAACTPYRPNFPGFDAEFALRAKTEVWPGTMHKTTIERFILPEFADWSGPKSMFEYLHVFDTKVLQRALVESGFKIEEIYYFNLDNPGELAAFIGDADHPSYIGAVATV